MKTQNPQVLQQIMYERQFGGIRVPAQQFVGVQDAIVTSVTPAAGTCMVTVTNFNSVTAFGPAAYPGSTPPPVGAKVVVSFPPPQPNTAQSSSPRVISMPGVGANASDFLSPFLLMGA